LFATDFLDEDERMVWMEDLMPGRVRTGNKLTTHGGLMGELSADILDEFYLFT